MSLGGKYDESEEFGRLRISDQGGHRMPLGLGLHKLSLGCSCCSSVLQSLRHASHEPSQASKLVSFGNGFLSLFAKAQAQPADGNDSP